MGIIFNIFLWLFGTIFTLIVVSVIGLIIYARWHYGKLEQCGIPVVKPHFFLGSNPDGHNKKAHLVDLERSKTYGSVYGVSPQFICHIFYTH